MRIDTYPVSGRLVVRIAYAVVAGFEFINAVGLAFERDDTIVVAVEKREHVSAHIKHQHTLSVLELDEREFLLNICTKREALVTGRFYIHIRV